MTLRARLTLWYVALLLLSLLLIFGWTYYEMFVEHRTPNTVALLRVTGESAMEELGEVFLYGSLPALLVALIGGWYFVRRALSPILGLTVAAERIHSHNLKERLPRTGSGDELDRLAEVFNAMMKRLEDSFGRIQEFTLHASHELKTPLTIMRGELETALRDDKLAPEHFELLASQLDEIQRLTRIVDGLTFLAKADAGQLPLSTAPLRLDELVKDSLADAQVLGQTRSVNVVLTACDEIMVNGDRHRLRQLLLNLTDNAIKYNRPQGAVRMSLHRRNGDAELLIANTGPGIAPEKLPRVFERFYRCDPARNSEVEGCGLGLSIAAWIARAHRGEITMASDPGQWTTVKVTLPADASPSMA
jgi:heavy metal sensor kinase